ncbi:hypothetical protein AB1L88_22115 [Tautonia sp. JC769]|uniref:hypothetical protein n=1 Tax=Tautonia sp. JC769 TaxID=3232135 RepID=UPI00345878D9
MNRPAARSPIASIPLEGVRVARIGRPDLAALAALRGRPGVRVQVQGESGGEGGPGLAWVAWEPAAPGARDPVVEALLPVPGVVFFRKGGGGLWSRVGRRLPEFAEGPPEGIDRPDWGWPLDRALVPEAIRGRRAGTVVEPIRLRLVRDAAERRATAVLVAIEGLLPWVERAPTARLQGLRGSRAGDRVLLIGDRLPPVVGLGRFWGDRVLRPVGFRLDPDLSEPMLAEAVGLRGADLALFDREGRVEVIPDRCLSVVSRASVRGMAGIDRRATGPGSGGGGNPGALP